MKENVISASKETMYSISYSSNERTFTYNIFFSIVVYLAMKGRSIRTRR